MTDNFDWLKDEESGWTEPDPPIKPLPSKARFKRIYIAAGLLLLFVIPIVVCSLFFFQRRIEQATETVESEIKSTHLVLLEAIKNGDYDLIESLLPNDDPRMRELLHDQIDRHLLIDRKSVGLISDFKMEDVKNSPVITITTSTDFTFAEVKSILPYRISPFDEPNDIVNLVLTLAYRREGERWVSSVLSEESDYWGEWVNLEEDLLTMTVPSLDADVAQEMIADLNQLSKNICDSSDVDCPSAFQLEIHFDRQQESVSRIGDPLQGGIIFPNEERHFLSMPTPTLVGRPIDKAGQEALYKGYAARMTSALVLRYANLSEDEMDDVLSALLQRNGLELPPRPHAVLPRIPVELRGPVPNLPSEDILLLCSIGSDINLFRLDIKNAVWSDEWKSFTPPIGSAPILYSAYVTPAPEHQGVLIHVTSFDEDQPLWQSYWWQESSMVLLVDDVEPYDVYPPTYQKDINRIGRFVRVVRDNQSGGRLELTTSWFDLGQCLAGPCEIQKAAGYPIWSTDGRHTLVVIVNPDGQLTLYRGDKNAQPIEFLGLGSSPFWISDSSFGYVRPAQVTLEGRIVDDPGNEIAVGNFPRDSAMVSTIRQIVKTQYLQDVLPADKEPGPLQILSVMPYSRNPDQWIVAASSSPDIPAENSYLFALDIDSQELSLILDLGDQKLQLPMLQSPDGRYLAFITSRGNDITFYIRNYASERTTKSERNFPVDWTDDGQWLLFFESEKMVLFSPDTDQEIDIPIHMSGCYSAVFTSEN